MPPLLGAIHRNKPIGNRFCSEPVKEVEATISRFDQNGVTIKGTILNKVERKANSYYGYGYGYGYSYKILKIRSIVKGRKKWSFE